jgi:hypothetical protein
MVMSHLDAHPEYTLRQLSGEELDRVSGGMKYDPNYVSPNVIDARGGQFDLLWWTFTLDVNGNISSIS